MVPLNELAYEIGEQMFERCFSLIFKQMQQMSQGFIVDHSRVGDIKVRNSFLALRAKALFVKSDEMARTSLAKRRGIEA